MKVFDKRADEILEKLETEGSPRIACAINRTLNAVKDCRIINCDECNKKMFKLLMEEYKESIKLSRLEYEVLKYLYTNCYAHLFRDGNRDLYAKSTINDGVQYLPFDDLFSFVGSEPTSIDDVLNNYEIVED